MTSNNLLVSAHLSEKNIEHELEVTFHPTANLDCLVVNACGSKTFVSRSVMLQFATRILDCANEGASTPVVPVDDEPELDEVEF